MLKILLKNRLMALVDQFSGQSKGKKAAQIGNYVFFGVLCLLLAGGAAAGVNAVFGGLCASFAAQGNTWAFYALAGAVGVFLALFVTLYYAQGVVFEAKDNELLLSMPIKPSAILGSRLGSVYFLNLLFSLIMLAAAAYTVGAQTGSVGILDVLLLILCILLLPLLSTTVSCLLAWVVSYLTRHTRKKVLVQTIISLIAMGVLYVVIMGVNKGFFEKLADSAGDIAAAFRSTLYPFYAMGMGIAEHHLLMLLAFAAICVVPFALVYILLSRSFIRIATARNAAKRLEYKAGTLKGSSVVWAMTKKDLTRFFNSPPYMMNAGLGLLYAIGMAAVTAFSGNDLAKNILENGAKFQNPAAYMTVIAAFMISFFAAMTTISGCSVSVEARNLWILKSMPVRAKEVLTGKLLSHLVLAVPASLICSTIYLFTTPELTVPGVVLMFLMPVAFNILNALLGLIGNLYYGKLDYPSIAKAAKSTSGALIPLLAIMLLVGGAVALYFILFREMIEVTVYGFIVTAAALIADLCLYSFLGSKAAQKRWDKLGQ